MAVDVVAEAELPPPQAASSTSTLISTTNNQGWENMLRWDRYMFFAIMVPSFS